MRNKSTLFVGKVLLHFPALGSTNVYAQELLAKSKPSEGTVISTFNQLDGRGQIGSSWESAPDKNITMSLILYPRFLPIVKQFELNQVISLAVSDFISDQLEKEIKIKWPNDIYIGDRKVAGILIQNTISTQRIQASIAGIGINVNQTDFPADIPNPTSLKLETGKGFELDILLSELCYFLENRYLQLRQGKSTQFKEEYLLKLYRYNEPATFQRAKGGIFKGKISGIDESGMLLIAGEKGIEAFNTKGVSFV